MAKSIKDILLDESPKGLKKIEKALEKHANTTTRENFETLKKELANDTFVDFPKLRVVVTNSCVCSYNTAITFTIDITPISKITNAFRSNIVNGEYDYDNFHLQLETTDHINVYYADQIRTKKVFTAYDEVVAEIKKRIPSENRGA